MSMLKELKSHNYIHRASLSKQNVVPTRKDSSTKEESILFEKMISQAQEAKLLTSTGNYIELQDGYKQNETEKQSHYSNQFESPESNRPRKGSKTMDFSSVPLERNPNRLGVQQADLYRCLSQKNSSNNHHHLKACYAGYTSDMQYLSTSMMSQVRQNVQAQEGRLKIPISRFDISTASSIDASTGENNPYQEILDSPLFSIPKRMKQGLPMYQSEDDLRQSRLISNKQQGKSTRKNSEEILDKQQKEQSESLRNQEFITCVCESNDFKDFLEFQESYPIIREYWRKLHPNGANPSNAITSEESRSQMSAALFNKKRKQSETISASRAEELPEIEKTKKRRKSEHCAAEDNNSQGYQNFFEIPKTFDHLTFDQVDDTFSMQSTPESLLQNQSPVSFLNQRFANKTSLQLFRGISPMKSTSNSSFNMNNNSYRRHSYENSNFGRDQFENDRTNLINSSSPFTPDKQSEINASSFNSHCSTNKYPFNTVESQQKEVKHNYQRTLFNDNNEESISYQAFEQMGSRQQYKLSMKTSVPSLLVNKGNNSANLYFQLVNSEKEEKMQGNNNNTYRD